MNTKEPPRKVVISDRRGKGMITRMPLGKKNTTAGEAMKVKASNGTDGPQAVLFAEPSPLTKIEPKMAPRAVKAASTAVPVVTPPPWEDIHDPTPMSFSMLLSRADHMKMVWLKNNMPNTSLRKIFQSALTTELKRLLDKHYK